MKNFKLFISLVLLLSLLLLFGCSNVTKDNQAEDNQMKFDLIASEKTLPSHFHEIAFKSKETPFFQYLVRKVNDQSEFEDTWNFYAFENQTPSIDLNEKDVFFIGVYESGSCPSKIKHMKLSSDNKTMTVSLTEPDGACTSDATPRTFVIQIDKEISKEIESVVIVQNGVETSIPFENEKFGSKGNSL
ncbi:hypothetical protein ACI7RC_11060 [Brevibacillus sp. B_LB10_24]|uniref:hypothetical protein n=1 Tax=Brevibacillus sp. B_LB10_24 TaxID=3380645 RepID=UPI0038BC4C57